ncbi:transposase [Umezawaea tangerina]|uniref:transposase n=1 Tax=Umezawaea tangerina TaxID=84725 RepID=UPI003CCBA62C
MQWAMLESLLPQPSRSGRPSLWSKRQLVDGIRWRVRVGAPWRDIPATFPRHMAPGRRCTRYSGVGSGPVCGR